MSNDQLYTTPVPVPEPVSASLHTEFVEKRSPEQIAQELLKTQQLAWAAAKQDERTAQHRIDQQVESLRYSQTLLASALSRQEALLAAGFVPPVEAPKPVVQTGPYISTAKPSPAPYTVETGRPKEAYVPAEKTKEPCPVCGTEVKIGISFHRLPEGGICCIDPLGTKRAGISQGQIEEALTRQAIAKENQ